MANKKSFTQKAIDVTIGLGKGDFGDGGFNTVKLQGCRVFASVQMLGGPAHSTAEVRIHGLTRSVMNSVSSIGDWNYRTRNNSIIVEAGDKGSPLTTIYSGGILDAFQSFNQQPEAFFQIVSSQYSLNVKTEAFSSDGEIDVADVMRNLATRGKYQFVNDGVTTKMSSVVLNGSALEMINSLATQAGIGHHFDANHALHIYPLNQPSKGSTPLVNAESGLIGYPDWISNGIKFRTLFNPAFIYNGMIQMESDLDQANGPWQITNLVYDLAAEVPGGNWFCDVECAKAVPDRGTSGGGGTGTPELFLPPGTP